jgi:hypothetical protein
MNGLSPKGLPHVIVNGQFVKRNNKATNVMAGQPIRYLVEDKPRFVTASKKKWFEEFSLGLDIDMGTFGQEAVFKGIQPRD